MKVLISLISICMGIILLGEGCSKEEDTQIPERGPRVVKPIIEPAPEMTLNPIKKSEKRVNPEVKETLNTTPVAGKIEDIKPPETEPMKAPEEPENEQGYYVVQEGDSLSQISARDDVYGSPLDWPILYRYNLDKLGTMAVGPDLPDRRIPQNLKLKIVTPDEIKDNREKRANQTWVINVLSTTIRDEIVAPAITLIKEGYPVYVTNAHVKGKEWMRLRVGFFKSKAEADAEGQKIMLLLNFVKPWTTKIAQDEHEVFAGY